MNINVNAKILAIKSIAYIFFTGVGTVLNLVSLVTVSRMLCFNVFLISVRNVKHLFIYNVNVSFLSSCVSSVSSFLWPAVEL